MSFAPLIHPTAVIDDSVELGEGVKVEPYAVIRGPSRIGAGCSIGSHAVIHPFVELGEACRVFAHAAIGGEPQDLGFDGAESRTVIGARNVFREYMTVHRGTGAGTETVIGDDGYFMVYSHVAHNCRIGNRVIFVNHAIVAGHVTVGDGVLLSSHTGVHQFCRIGTLAMMGAGSAISTDLPPYCTTYPTTVNSVVGLNTVGMRRAGLSAEARTQIKRAFGLLFRSGLTAAQAVERIRSEVPAGPAQAMADFAEGSERGLVKLHRKPE